MPLLEEKIVKARYKKIRYKVDTAFKSGSVYNTFKDIKLFKRDIKFNTKELYFICRQFSMAFNSGMDILRSIEAIEENTINKNVSKVFAKIHESVQSGLLLSQSIKLTNAFPLFFVNMIEAGEVSGRLEYVLNSLSDYYEKELRLKKKITQALLYPTFVVIFTTLVFYIMLVKVVPMFVNVLNQFPKIELPKQTRLIISLSDFLRENNEKVIISILIFAITHKVFIQGRFKNVVDYLKIKIPIIKNLYKLNISIKFLGSMGILTKSGISYINSIEIASKVIENIHIQEELINVKDSLLMGDSLSESISRVKFFPKLLKSMLKTAEETGKLEVVFENMHRYYLDEFEDKLKIITSLLEPAMIIVVASIVGFLIMSIILPIFNIYRGMM
ncbi:MAG: type II secretion system F family protein [Clostridiales bacterium]|nr:type II secretion system F family protein [Clostridiales bacterium]